MADYGEEKGSGAWARVPVWDGSPATWRSFKREMTWWVSRALSATIWQRGGQVSSRKSSGKFPCFDCNMHGHWAGDKECTMPGAGLGRNFPQLLRNRRQNKCGWPKL